ncbi:hypothetical protein GCM10018952_39910 [Streptosporangium vulgare]
MVLAASLAAAGELTCSQPAGDGGGQGPPQAGGYLLDVHYYRETWLVDRLGSTMQAAFGHKPCVDIVSETGQQAVINRGAHAEAQRCESEWARGRTPRRRAATTCPSCI